MELDNDLKQAILNLNLDFEELKQIILNDYIEFLEDYIIRYTNTRNRYELFIEFIINNIDDEGS